MFIQIQAMPVETAPKAAAIFQAANCTLDKALGYDVMIMEEPGDRKKSVKRTGAHVIKKGNFYTGAVNPTARTFPVGLSNQTRHR